MQMCINIIYIYTAVKIHTYTHKYVYIYMLHIFVVKIYTNIHIFRYLISGSGSIYAGNKVTKKTLRGTGKQEKVD